MKTGKVFIVIIGFIGFAVYAITSEKTFSGTVIGISESYYSPIPQSAYYEKICVAIDGNKKLFIKYPCLSRETKEGFVLFKEGDVISGNTSMFGNEITSIRHE